MKDFFEKSIEIVASRDKIRRHLIEYAREFLGLNEVDLAKPSYLSYLVNVLSVLSSNLIFYNSSIYREFFLNKARQKESVLNLATMLGYQVRSATPATTSVLVSIPTGRMGGTTGTIVIPGIFSTDTGSNIFKVTTADGIEFTPKDTVQIRVDYLPSPTGSVLTGAQIQIIDSKGEIRELPYAINTIGEGSMTVEVLDFIIDMIQLNKRIEIFYVPSLEPYQFLTQTLVLEPNEYLYNIEIYSGEETSTYNPETVLSRPISEWITGLVKWTYTPSIYLVSPDDRCFTYRFTSDGLRLIFGNGVIGKQPKSKDLVTVILTTTKGTRGNVIPGAINTTETLLKRNLDGSELTVETTFVNITNGVGGQNYPTIEEIRKEVINHVVTNKRLVTKQDYSNITSIIPDLPIQNAYPVVKRSDLKCNEITLFSTLVFSDEIVPTRNEVILVPDDLFENQMKFLIPRYTKVRFAGYEPCCDEVLSEYVLRRSLMKYTRDGDIISDESDDVLYDIEPEYIRTLDGVTMFDIIVDKLDFSCQYCYLVHKTIEVPIFHEILAHRLNIDGFLVKPVQMIFENERTSLQITTQPLKITVKIAKTSAGALERYYVNHSPGSNPSYSDIRDFGYVYKLTCQVVYNQVVYYLYYDPELSSLDPEHFYFTNFTTDESVKDRYATLDLPVLDYDSGKVEFTIRVILEKYRLNELGGVERSTGEDIVYVWKVNTAIKQDLSEIISSPIDRVIVKKNLGCFYNKVFWRIFDTPILSKSYYEYLKNTDQLSLFEKNIYHKFIEVDIRDYRMLTDSVSFKFADTYGVFSNMLYFNKVNRKETVIEIDPDELPECPSYNDAVAIISYEKGRKWTRDLGISDLATGYIVKYVGSSGLEWTGPYKLKNNEIVLYRPRNESDYVSKLIYNGERLVPPVQTLPLTIVADVWLDYDVLSTISDKISNTSIVEMIKEHLIYKLFPLFGYESVITRADIEQAIKSVKGVKSCVLLEPKFDIYYNFDIDYLTFGQLIRYKLQYIYATKDSIVINIVKE